MTTFFLIRHCALDALGRYLAGRAPGERLNTEGLAQAARLRQRFAGVRLDAVYSSPLERACETAASLAECASGGVECTDALLEIDFGEWTGKTFEELDGDPVWSRFNTHRSQTRIPAGEIISEVQARAVGFLTDLAARKPGETVAVVSHGDVLRSALAHFLGMPIDAMQRFEISPGSVSVLELDGGNARVLCMNVIDFDPRRFLAR